MNYNVINYKSIAEEMNSRVFSDFFYRLMLVARSVFEWRGLPNNIDEKWIEKYLFSEGKCVFFKDKMRGFMVAQITQNGPLNHYYEPTTVIPYSVDYFGKKLENGIDCVIIRNNDDMIPTSPTIQLYAYKLTNIDRTIDININLQKIPNIIKGTDKQKLSLKHAIEQRDENELVIWADKSFDSDAIDVLKTDAPIVFDKLEIQKHMIWNECMTFLGINNANMDKRERLVDDEVQANNEQVEAMFNIMFKARQQACKDINRIFGTNISVHKRIMKKPNIDDSELDYNPLTDSEGDKK